MTERTDPSESFAPKTVVPVRTNRRDLDLEARVIAEKRRRAMLALRNVEEFRCD